MRDTSSGWRALAVLVALRVLAADRTLAGEIPLRRTDTPSPAGRRVVVSIPHRKLAVIERDAVRRVFDVAVGAPDSPSPVGTFIIVNRLDRPTYYKPGVVIPPGPTNPLGTRWLGLDIAGYGIHGTDNPRSIGHARSHGCIRLRNRDVEELFALVRAGDTVEIHEKPSPELARLFESAGASEGTGLTF